MHAIRLSCLLLASCVSGCGPEAPNATTFERGAATASDASTEDAPADPVADANAAVAPDAPGGDHLGQGEGCVGVKARATLEKAPVDIIWVVDNSGSMGPAIDEVTRGINAFAQRIGASNLDYRVIMLSLRGRGSSQGGDSERYGVCVPAPLAGDGDCGNGDRFFHSSVDIRSTQPLEQLLGILGQTRGYRSGEPRGGEGFRDQLREGATKSIVVVTDDNARLSANDFEHFPGGVNPFSSTDLPPGILDGAWQGIFDGYIFHGIYGWGSTSDPRTACTYPSGEKPSASGTTYSTLVSRTGGVRAQICKGSLAWEPFFAEVAKAVEKDARVACDLTIPEAPSGAVLDPQRVNVLIRLPGAPNIPLKKVAPAACRAEGGWYYDNDVAPTRVTLCPESCALAQEGADRADAGVDVEFGCATIVE